MAALEYNIEWWYLLGCVEREESMCMYVKAQKFTNAQQGAGESYCDFLVKVEDLSQQ